jgi:hypothetical protein
LFFCLLAFLLSFAGQPSQRFAGCVGHGYFP